MANFVVSNTSKNKIKAIQFLNLLNSDPVLLNGLVYGIEGKAWEKIEKSRDKIKLLSGYTPTNHMGAWNTGNNALLYTEPKITDTMIQKRDDTISSTKESPLLGFNFDVSGLKSEISNISNVMKKYVSEIQTGTADPDKTIPELNEELKQAGYDKVLKEMQSQYSKFLKSE